MASHSLRSRYWVHIFLLVGLLALVLPAGAVADYHDAPEVIQHTAVFSVTDPPLTPFHVHQSMLLFKPGAEAPLHRHGGPGYITILSGELTLYEDGIENRYHPGESLVETPDRLYKGGNYTEQGMTLLVTYLIPHGEEVTTVIDDPEAPDPPEISPEPLAETVWDFQTAPDAFDLIHTVSTFQPAASTGSMVADGDTVVTVVNGSLLITMNGNQQSVGPGDAILIGAGQEYVMENGNDSDAMAMSTEMAPYTQSVLPQAGAPYQEPIIFWLLVMVSSALLVIGGVLRIGASQNEAEGSKRPN